MPWSGIGSQTGLAVTTEVFYTNIIQLNPGESCHLQVKADFTTSPTDHLRISIYTTLDDSAEDWDTDPYQRWTMLNDVDPRIRSEIIRGPYRFRVGFIRDGSSDTITVDIKHKVDTVDFS